MSQAIPVRTNYTAGEVRRFAQRAKRCCAGATAVSDCGRARRCLAGRGHDRWHYRQTLRDLVIRFNEQGPLCAIRGRYHIIFTETEATCVRFM